MMKPAMVALLVGLSGTAYAGPQSQNVVTDFAGLGVAKTHPYGEALINPGLHTTDGAFTLTLVTGEDPSDTGFVTFKLNSVSPGYAIPCVFSFGFANGLGLDPALWPFGAQIGEADSSTDGAVSMYWRTAPNKPLAPKTAYVVKGICPQKLKNPPQGH